MAIIFVLLVLLVGSVQAEILCNVTTFGATGDGVTYDTPAIQQAIDFCAAQVQALDGTDDKAIIILPPPGRYLTGTIFLWSRTILRISPGATLLASPSQDHYPTLQSRWYLVLAENVSDVGITGSDGSFADFNVSADMGIPSSEEVGATSSDVGTIDGQSSKFVESFNSIKNVMVSWNQTGDCYGDECRPRLIGFLDCQGVHMWDIQLQQPAYWCIHIVRSSYVSIHHVSIVGDFNTPNNDGIDVDSSNNTSIHSCNIDTGDDAICPKTAYGPVHNLTVSRCWVRTKSCGVKLGSASSYNFYGLKFDSINIVDSHRGIGLQLRDSGDIFDIVFSNFKVTTRYYDPSWWGRAEPIYVTSCPRSPATVVGSIYNVSFVNITAVSENGIFMSGPEGALLRNIRLENVNLQLQRSTNYTGGLLDYRPGCLGLVRHQNSGIFIERLTGLLLKDVKVSLNLDMQTPFVPIEITPATMPQGMEFVDFLLFYQTSLSVQLPEGDF